MLKRLGLTFVLTAAMGGSTFAMPSSRPDTAAPALIPVANGCGPGFFRNIAGRCLPNAVVVGPRGRVAHPPPCPRGFLRDPNPARPLCYPIR